MPPKDKTTSKSKSLPKGKMGKNAGAKGKVVTVGDDGDPKEMTKTQLERVVAGLRKEVEIAKGERNFLQLERDKISQFWEITRQQLSDARGELRTVDREMEEKEEEHQRSIKVNKMMAKHLVHEHISDIAEIQAEKLISLDASQKLHDEQELMLLRDKKNQHELMLEMQQQHQEEIRALKMELTRKISQEREQLKTAGQDLEESYEERLSQQRENLTLRFNMELAEIEERKNLQIVQLLRNHEKAFEELKAYYNDVTLNQLALISSLKEQMAERKMSEERIAKVLRETQNVNKSLVEPLKQAKDDAAELSRQLINCQKDKQSLEITKKRLNAALKELDTLRWERDVLLLQNEKIMAERGIVRDSVKLAVEEEHFKSGIRTALLERNLQVLKELLQKRETRCTELLHAVRMEPGAHTSVSTKVGKLLSDKNSIINSLQRDLDHVVKVHNDIVDECQAVLQECGMPEDVLKGFNLLRITQERLE